MTIKIIACEVMKEELLSIEPVTAVEYEFVPMALHLYPEKLGNKLQDIINKSQGYSRVVLAFGLCGGALRGLQASNCILTIPKVHDCISIFLNLDHEDSIYEKQIGTFYLSCGWMITEKSILSEHKRIKEKYGEKKALRILERMYDSYRRVLFIKTGCSSEEVAMEQSKQIAELLKLRHETVKGSNGFMENILNGPWDNKKFININPFEIVIEEEFSC